MAIHLTPTELGREAGMHRREVIAKCMELGVPIFQGRIDKTLFKSSLKEMQGKRQDAGSEPGGTFVDPFPAGALEHSERRERPGAPHPGREAVVEALGALGGGRMQRVLGVGQ